MATILEDSFEYVFFNENVWILIKISLKFVPKGPISNIPALVQTVAWRRPGDKPLYEPMMVSLLTHVYVTRPQWVKRPYFLSLLYLAWGNQINDCTVKVKSRGYNSLLPSKTNLTKLKC